MSSIPHIQTEGLVWKPLEVEHVAELAALIERMEKADNPPYRTSPEEVASLFSQGIEWEACGGWDLDGTLRGYGITRLVPSDTVAQAVCSGGVDPTWRNRGIGGAVLDWEIEVSRRLLHEATDGVAEIVIYVDDTAKDFTPRLRAAGFVEKQSFAELRRELSAPIEPIEPGQYLSVVPWSEDLDDQIRKAHNRLMEAAVGAPPKDAEAWAVEGRDFFAPEWSFVALDKSTDRAQVAGYLLSARYEQDWEALGWKEGYTEILGVLPQWRNTKLAPALLTAAMNAYHKDGMEYAAVGLATDNYTGAADLYQRLGYVSVGGSTMWVIEIIPGVTTPEN